MNLIKTFIFEINDANILKTCFEIFLVLVLDVYKFSIFNIYNISIPQFPNWKKSIFVSRQQCDLHRNFCIDKKCVQILIAYRYIYIYIYKFTLYALICKYQIRIYFEKTFFLKSQLYFGLFKNPKTVHQTKGGKPIFTQITPKTQKNNKKQNKSNIK